MKALYFSIAAGLALSACDMANKADAPANDSAAVDTAAEEAAIKVKEAGWMEAYAKKDAAALAAEYADDAASPIPARPSPPTPPLARLCSTESRATRH